jgi:hypothetical protein
MSNFTQLLNWGPISRTRRNHALEHASLHILAQKCNGQFLAGHSDAKGIRIIGDISTQEIQQVVDEALARLQAGEGDLAYHPNCGTNFTTAGAVAGMAAWTGMLGSDNTFKDKVNRLPIVIFLVTLVLILTRPLGPYIQRYITTNPLPGSMHVTEIQRHDFGNIVVHRVLTRD